jgi:hypothetical protein
VALGEHDVVATPEGYLADLGHTVPHEDPRWPTTCICGYAFTDTDQWQVNQHALYLLPDGTTCDERKLPPGAFREAWWLGDEHRGPDGKCWLLRLPAGGIDWSVYGPSTGDNPAPWTVTGTIPVLTASPSIHAVGTWHGNLRDGVLDGA